MLQFGSFLTSIQVDALLVVSYINLQGIFENQRSIEIILSTIANEVYESIVGLCL
jgi:hypothetical protein